MDDEEPKTLTPKLRFPEFQDNPGWDGKTLREIAEPVTEKAEAGDGSQILTLSGEYGIVLQSEYFGKQVAGTNSERYIKIARDDFVYNDRTTKQAAFGTIKRLCEHERGIVSPIYKCFRFDPGENPTFWDFYFESGIHDAELRQLVNEGARAGRFNISIDKFLSTTGWRPESDEQQKIVDCLASLDEVIAAQGLKVVALEAHKKGLMQQLFPREGETLPRLRFPEFGAAPAWEEEKLGKHVDIWSGGSPSEFALSSDGAYPFVKVEDLNNCAKYQITAREFCDDGEGVVPRQSILFPKRGAAIELNKIRVTGTEILIDTNLMAISPKDGLTTEFLFYYVSNIGLAHIADTSTIPQINNKHIIPFAFLFPSVAEQQRIANLLSSLDFWMAPEVKKLAAFKTHKQGLMQQLFPMPEEG